jgi:hypothetical protein
MEYCLNQEKYNQNQTMLAAMQEYYPDMNCFVFPTPGLLQFTFYNLPSERNYYY